MQGEVRLHRHNPFWRVLFGIEKARLGLVLTAQVLTIAHVGSTAIPRLPAKPVIDISVVVADGACVWDLVEALKAAGYRYLGEVTALRCHSFEKDHPFACALLLCEPGCDTWKARQRFRDALRADPQTRGAYATLKRSLACRHAHDLRAYQCGKLEFVSQVMASLDKH